MSEAWQAIIPEGAQLMWLHARSRSPSPDRNPHTLPVRRQSRLLLFVTLVLGLSALGLPSVVAQTPATVAAVRVIHASPDSPAVDVYLDGEKTVSALAFTQARGYLVVPAGTHRVQVFGQSVTPATGAALLTMPAVTIPANAQLSLVVEGLFGSMRLHIIDDATPAPAAGRAKLRFVHAGSEVPAVDVSVKGGPVLYTNTQFGLAYPYQDIDATRHDLQVSLTGGAGSAAVLTSITAEAGKNYSVYLMSLGVVQVFPDTAMLPAAAPGGPSTGVSMPTASGAGVSPGATVAPPVTTMVPVSAMVSPRTSAPVASVAPVATARVPSTAGRGTAPAAVMLPATGAPVPDGGAARLWFLAAVLLVMGGVTVRHYSTRRGARQFIAVSHTCARPATWSEWSATPATLPSLFRYARVSP